MRGSLRFYTTETDRVFSQWIDYDSGAGDNFRITVDEDWMRRIVPNSGVGIWYVIVWDINRSSSGPYSLHVEIDGQTSQNTHTHTLPFVRGASSTGQESLVRIINRSATSGTVQITAIDDTGERFGPVTLTLGARRSVNITSGKLERGDSRAGLPVGIGNGIGSWRLELKTALTIEPLAYVRQPDGLLTSMHDVAPVSGANHNVPFFNPGSNIQKSSLLRLINPGTAAAAVTITGRDDMGDAASGTVRLTLPAGAARTYSAHALEVGGVAGLNGSLGRGTGKWRLNVRSTSKIQVMNLLSTRTGQLANLSTSPSYEPGEMIDNATPINPGEAVTGDLSSPTDVDFYRLPIASPGTVTFWTTGDADTVITIHDSDGNDLSAARDSAADGDATIAYSSRGRVSVTTGLDDVLARVTGREGGSTGSYSLHNEVVENLAPRIIKPFTSLSMKAGGAAVSVNLAEYFRDPEGEDLTFSASLQGTPGPISLGLTVSGSLLSIASPANFQPGPVNISITASDPFNLVTVQVLSVTIQPRDNPPEPPEEPPINPNDLDGCVTVRRSIIQCPVIGGQNPVADMTNRCSFEVRVRFSFVPSLPTSPGPSYGAIGIAPGATYRERTYGCYDSFNPRFRFCVYRDDVPHRSPDSRSRCTGDNARWQHR